MAKTNDKRIQSVRKYRDNNYKHLSIGLHRTNDADVIEYLETLPNKRAYILKVIRNDIEMQKFDEPIVIEKAWLEDDEFEDMGPSKFDDLGFPWNDEDWDE